MWWILACAPPAPPAPWVPGELVIAQLHLPGVALGESTLVITPSGSSTLIDVGNDGHAEAVAEAVERHLGKRAVDRVILTHYHADHIGAMDELALDIGAIVWRGAVSLNEGSTTLDEWQEVCRLDVPKVAFCSGPVEATCELDGGEAPWPADTCMDNLLLETGDVAFELLGGNGRAGLGGLELPAEGDDAENARSLMGRVTFGSFDYVFAGDLTGGGKGTEDVEARVVDEGVLPVAEVAHVSHHGIDSSTSAAWLDAVFPEDGADHHALVGATDGYGAAPDDDVLARLEPHLGPGGAVWAPEAGWWAGRSDRLKVTDTEVVVRVQADGSYTVEGGGEVVAGKSR